MLAQSFLIAMPILHAQFKEKEKGPTKNRFMICIKYSAALPVYRAAMQFCLGKVPCG